MADEATGQDREPRAGSTSGGSVHGSPDRDCADLASHSAANRTRSYDRAKKIFPMPLSSRPEFLARARLVVLLGTALPALAQVPGDFVKITDLELSSGTPTLEYENVGQKPVTAFAIENLTREHKGE